jgi:hypothetical protein
MTTKKTKDTVRAHFDALFAGDARVTIQELRNIEDPTPPRTESDIDGKATVFLQYPPTKEMVRGIGAANIPWDEVGAFMVHVAVASFSSAAEVLADEISKTVRDSLRNQTIGADTDIGDIFGTDLAHRWGGNFYGESISVEFETQNI